MTLCPSVCMSVCISMDTQLNLLLAYILHHGFYFIKFGQPCSEVWPCILLGITFYFPMIISKLLKVNFTKFMNNQNCA